MKALILCTLLAIVGAMATSEMEGDHHRPDHIGTDTLRHRGLRHGRMMDSPMGFQRGGDIQGFRGGEMGYRHSSPFGRMSRRGRMSAMADSAMTIDQIRVPFGFIQPIVRDAMKMQAKLKQQGVLPAGHGQEATTDKSKLAVRNPPSEWASPEQKAQWMKNIFDIDDQAEFGNRMDMNSVSYDAMDVDDTAVTITGLRIPIKFMMPLIKEQQKQMGKQCEQLGYKKDTAAALPAAPAAPATPASALPAPAPAAPATPAAAPALPEPAAPSPSPSPAEPAAAASFRRIEQLPSTVTVLETEKLQQKPFPAEKLVTIEKKPLHEQTFNYQFSQPLKADQQRMQADKIWNPTVNPQALKQEPIVQPKLF